MGQLGSIYLDIRNWLQQHQNEFVWVTESQGEFQNQKHPVPELVRNADLPSPLLNLPRQSCALSSLTVAYVHVRAQEAPLM